MGKPDYTLKIFDKSTEGRTYIGAGWKNEDESITIVLNPAVVLNYEYCLDKIITLFPYTEFKDFNKIKGKKKKDKKGKNNA